MSVETSIIIRTLNEAKHLENLLSGIRDQNYSDCEVLLVDSGSTDGTLDIAQRYGVSIYHIPTEEFTFGRALNLGCGRAQGRYLVFASGHVWPVSNNWLRNLIKPFEEPSIGMIYGRQRGVETSSLSELRDLYVNYGLSSKILVDEPNGNNGNAAIRRDLWLRQPFDESLPGLEDIDWAKNIQQQGYRIYYAADAAVYHVHEETLKQVHRRYLREAIAYKRIFPGHRFSRTELAKGISYAIVRDFLYALRHRRLRQVLQVPGTRLAEYLGTYQGNRWHRKRSRVTVGSLEIPKVSKSVVVEEPGHHELKDTVVPEVGAGEVLIRVAYAGVCATDLALASGPQDTDGPVRYPLSPGHEFSGVVVKIGPSVRGLKKGQKVVGRGSGRGSVGAYCRFLKLPARYVYPLPDDIPLKSAVLIETVATSLATLKTLPISPGNHVCVVGAGPLGNVGTQLLRHKGIRVSVVDPNEQRLKLLHKYDVDTHTKLGPLDDYDYYLVEANDHSLSMSGLEKKQESVAVISCSGRSAALDSQNTGGGSEFDLVMDTAWREAIRLVGKGTVNLYDHTAVVEPLEEYQRVWHAQANCERFKVLLSAGPELEDL